MDLLARVLGILPILIVLLVPVFLGYHAVRDCIKPSRELRVNPASPLPPAKQIKEFRIVMVLVFAICVIAAWLVVHYMLIPAWTASVLK